MQVWIFRSIQDPGHSFQVERSPGAKPAWEGLLEWFPATARGAQGPKVLS